MVLKERGVFTNSTNETATLFDYVYEDGYVLIRDRPAVDHLIYADYKYRRALRIPEATERVLCPFAVSQKPFMTRKRSFAYNKNFPFKELFDPQ